jgi:hypothetical protein
MEPLEPSQILELSLRSSLRPSLFPYSTTVCKNFIFSIKYVFIVIIILFKEIIIFNKNISLQSNKKF